MKNLKQIIIITIILFGFSFLFCQEHPAEKLVILPFNAIGIDSVFMKSAQSILRFEIEQISSKQIISEEETVKVAHDNSCTELDCAVEIGKELAATEVLICNFSALGEKIVIHYLLVDVPSEKIVLIDKTSSVTIEDLDAVLIRIAKSIVENESIEKNVEVGSIIEKEMETPRRRKSHRFAGLSFGYLYPQKGYDNSDRIFSIDARTGAEMKNVMVGMQIAVRQGFAMNIFSNYLFSKKDFCPYLGGAFGFHWVHHNNYYDANDKKSDGFELTANAGIIAFRTYNFQVISNLAYTYTLNDYDDQAIIFTIGLLF